MAMGINLEWRVPRLALVAGARVVVQRHNGDEVADIDTGEPICSNCTMRPVALRPFGSHVAVVLNTKTVAVYDYQSGKQAYQIDGLGGLLAEVNYSPDGGVLATVTFDGGFVVHDAESGRAIHTLTDKPDYGNPLSVGYDAASTRIFSPNWGGAGVIATDLETGEKVQSFDGDLAAHHGHKFMWPCFDDDAGPSGRLAYLRIDHKNAASTVIRSYEQAGEPPTVIEHSKEAGLVGPKGFKDNWLLHSSFELDDSATSAVTLVDLVDRGAETELNQMLPAVLGCGFTAHSSVGWVPGVPPTIHATVGSTLVFVNLADFETSLSDGCFGAQLLMDVCGDGTPNTIYQPQVISAIVARFPDCINVPKRSGGNDADEGDTVLHYCARKHRTDAVKRLLPLDGGAVFTPVSNGPATITIGDRCYEFDAWTALTEAIKRNNKEIAMHLLATLNTKLNKVTSKMVTAAMTLMALMMPRLVPEALVLLESRVVRKEATIETRIHAQDAAFVSGQERLQHEVIGKTTQSSAEKNLAEWGEDVTTAKPILPSTRRDSRLAQVNISIVQLADFIGRQGFEATGDVPPNPFGTIVTNCDFHVCESKIMQAAVDFKWSRLQWWILLDLVVYSVSLVVAVGAMIGAAWESSNPWERTHIARSPTALLILTMIICESILLLWECKQMVSRQSNRATSGSPSCFLCTHAELTISRTCAQCVLGRHW